MASWTTISDATLAAGKALIQSVVRALRDNATAITEGASGAPKVQTAALEQTASSEAVTTATLRDLNVTEAKLAASSVSQGKLKTSLGQLLHSSGWWALPGGEYGFFPQIGSGTGAAEYSHLTAYLDRPVTPEAETLSYPWFYESGTSWGGRVYLDYTGTENAGHVQQRYVSASPPYDYGHGPAHLFVFLKLDVSGNLRGISVAPDPPWAYHGPTWIVADYHRVVGKKLIGFQRRLVVPEDKSALLSGELQWEEVEVTQALKNADMDIMPHPFGEEPGIRVVMLDPACEIVARLAALHDVVTNDPVRGGVDSFEASPVGYLLHEGYITVDAEPLDVRTPKGIMTVAPKLKRTR
jgi:hypothetical protein